MEAEQQPRTVGNDATQQSSQETQAQSAPSSQESQAQICQIVLTQGTERRVQENVLGKEQFQKTAC